MLDKKQLTKDYKLQKQPVGIYAIHNKADKEITAELNELEELWIEKLKDDGVSFYNKKV